MELVNLPELWNDACVPIATKEEIDLINTVLTGHYHIYGDFIDFTLDSNLDCSVVLLLGDDTNYYISTHVNGKVIVSINSNILNFIKNNKVIPKLPYNVYYWHNTEDREQFNHLTRRFNGTN